MDSLDDLRRCFTGSGSLPSLAALTAGTRLGPYEIRDVLGQGGAGIVYRAWDNRLGRWVALKALRDGLNAQTLARFRREARLVAKLDHPNIVSVHDAGVSGGVEYIVMHCVDGRNLVEWRQEGGFDLRRGIELLVLIADAVAHAHEKGVFHRDLKPQNLLVAADGKPYVTDFGLARETRVDSSLTVTGVALGTPGYMSPEQARGDSGSYDARGDVYGLGSILFFLLTGRPPFEGVRLYDVLDRTIRADPVLPADAPRDLRIVCLRALEKAPARRYPTAKAFAADLRRFLAGEPILARPPTVGYRLRKRIRSNPAAFGIGALALLVPAILLPLWWGARVQKSRAERATLLWSRIAPVFSDADLYARAGEIARARERREEGIRICREHLQIGETALARYFLGRLLRGQGRPEEAKRELTRALNMDSALGEARFERGLLLVEEYESRLAAFRLSSVLSEVVVGPSRYPSAEDLERRHPDLRNLRESAVADLSADVGASSYFRPADSRFGQGELKRMKGDLEGALQDLEATLKLEPLYAPAFVSLASIALESGNFDEAIRKASRAADSHRGFGRAHLVRCYAYGFQWDVDPEAEGADDRLTRCVEDARKAIELGEETAEAYRQLGGGHWRQAHAQAVNGLDPRAAADRARKSFDHAIELNPATAENYVGRGMTHNLMGDALRERGADPAAEYSLAVADFDRALERNRHLALAHFHRGRALLGQGQSERGIADLDRALELDPDMVSARLSRAIAYVSSGANERAVEECTPLIEKTPAHSGALSTRGYAFLGMARFAEALLDFDRAVESSPKSAWMHYHRATAHLALARQEANSRPSFTRAIEDYTRALTLGPHHLDWHGSRGSAYLFRGADRSDFLAAKEDFTRALEFEPRDPSLHLNRGEAEFQLKEYAAAETDWKRAVELDGSLAARLEPLIEECARARRP